MALEPWRSYNCDMKLIIGLGNIGARYAQTRHNVGFMVVDELARRHDASWKIDAKLRAEVATLNVDGQKLVLAKPQTMMNLSGEAAQRIVQCYKLTPSDVWAVYDDVDTPFGRLRTRHGGSAGGHQGVRSLGEHIGDGFMRIKIGISLNDRAVEPSEMYVLKPFDDTEKEVLPTLIQAAAIAITSFVASVPHDTTATLLASIEKPPAV